MNRNFSIRDAVLFELSGEILDVCELLSVGFRPGSFPTVEMLWRVGSSNQQLQIIFSQVQDFIIRGRDEEYPSQSGAALSIVGFSNGDPDLTEPELYVEPTHEMNYITFVMNDRSAFAIKAGSANMRLL